MPPMSIGLAFVGEKHRPIRSYAIGHQSPRQRSCGERRLGETLRVEIAPSRVISLKPHNQTSMPANDPIKAQTLPDNSRMHLQHASAGITDTRNY